MYGRFFRLKWECLNFSGADCRYQTRCEAYNWTEQGELLHQADSSEGLILFG